MILLTDRKDMQLTYRWTCHAADGMTDSNLNYAC